MERSQLVAAIGKAFVTDLEENVTPEQFQTIRTLNDARTPGVCHSHDFVDANECMEAAFTRVMGRGPEGTEPAPEVYADPDLSDTDIRAIELETEQRHAEDNNLWSAAWDWAVEMYLSHSPAATILEEAGWPEVNRADLIRSLESNDPNGVYSDEDMAAEGATHGPWTDADLIVEAHNQGLI